jgi:hypothetical protein
MITTQKWQCCASTCFTGTLFFAGLDIKNFWFDTFNTHDYDHTASKVNRRAVDPQHYQDLAGKDWPSYEDFAANRVETVPPGILEEIMNMFDPPLPSIHNLIDHDKYPRDLLNYLYVKNGIPTDTNASYHHSNWKIDQESMIGLVKSHILNPHSLHPTAQAHEQIADLFHQILPDA